MKRMIVIGITMLIFSCITFSACEKFESDTPKEIKKLIRKNMQNGLSEVVEYKHKEYDVVYFFSYSRCNDCFSDLYNEKGNLLCHPDGGFSGYGDKKCTDFFEKATTVKVIWTFKK